jgi:pimeloyl-ACP methyl ester carboxylesterase
MDYLRLGSGPPLVMSPGLGASHANPPAGLARRIALSSALPFAEHFTVYLLNRRTGLPAGASLSDIAADYAHVMEHELGGPVSVHGTSTGGSVALQLAVDHPRLVRRLVLASAACRLSPWGRRAQAELARLTRAGDVRRAWAPVIEASVPPVLRRLSHPLAWVVGPRMTADDPSDMLVTLDAEDVFDAEPHLGRVEAPTLVIGGGADPLYSEDLFRRTAAGIRQGHAVVLRGKGHVYASGSRTSSRLGLGFLLAP